MGNSSPLSRTKFIADQRYCSDVVPEQSITCKSYPQKVDNLWTFLRITCVRFIFSSSNDTAIHG